MDLQQGTEAKVENSDSANSNRRQEDSLTLDHNESGIHDSMENNSETTSSSTQCKGAHSSLVDCTQCNRDGAAMSADVARLVEGSEIVSADADHADADYAESTPVTYAGTSLPAAFDLLNELVKSLEMGIKESTNSTSDVPSERRERPAIQVRNVELDVVVQGSAPIPHSISVPGSISRTFNEASNHVEIAQMNNLVRVNYSRSPAPLPPSALARADQADAACSSVSLSLSNQANSSAGSSPANSSASSSPASSSPANSSASSSPASSSPASSSANSSANVAQEYQDLPGTSSRSSSRSNGAASFPRSRTEPNFSSNESERELAQPSQPVRRKTLRKTVDSFVKNVKRKLKIRKPASCHSSHEGCKNVFSKPLLSGVSAYRDTEDGNCECESSMWHKKQRAHTTVDYVHCVVPGLTKITSCGFYWGVMDRYEAEALLENKPEGTFLLRDSSQEDFLFSVSFRRYGRSLHARIEQCNHKFSFDAHDSGVFKADDVTDLIEHYKDPVTCMFFEPMLTRPLNRPEVFSLQQLARAAVCDNISYDSIDDLAIPRTLQDYLRYYHYKVKLRTRVHSSRNSADDY